MADIRISKLLRQFNIGLDDLVEFLHKQGVEVDANPNAKVSDEHLPALMKQFGKDLEMKQAADKVEVKITEILEKSGRRPAREEPEEEEGAEEADIEENKKLKRQLDKITGMLREAAVTNVNLGGIIKLISENSTSKEEKRDIINRFTNEVHTIEESKRLYQAIDSELKKNPHVASNINEEQQFGNSNADVINESKFYQDESLMNSLGLMHRICK